MTPQPTDIKGKRAFYDSFRSVVTVSVALVLMIVAIVIWLISHGHH